MIGEREERMLKFTWFEILKTPFSAFLVGFALVSGFVTYHLIKTKEEEAKEAKKDLKECNDGRLKDRDTYNSFLQNLKTNNELKKDSI